MSKKLLLICGSLNQTTMMHQISQSLPQYDCFFTPFYATGLLGVLQQLKLLEFSILGGKHFKAATEYLASKGLQVDFKGKQHTYDGVITCTDLVIQENIRGKRLILVQEGMTEPEDFFFTLVKTLKLPRYLANTAATGLSDAYDVFCVASQGYRNLFIRKGVKADKIVVTGIPNFDQIASSIQKPFAEKGYILVATSSIRETGKPDDRMQFLANVKQLANGRKVIFKLHPNERPNRAIREIRCLFPAEEIIATGDINSMIANCEVLITQTSSVVFFGLILGKEVHSYFDPKELEKLLPIQNNGKSATWIANIVDHIMQTPLKNLRHAGKRQRLIRQWQPLDG
jgi:hypothetical protein